MGDRKSRFFRIDIQRSQIHLEMRMDLRYIKTGDSLDFHSQSWTEGQFYPSGESVRLEPESLTGNFQKSAVSVFVNGDCQGEPEFFFLFQQIVFRSGDVSFNFSVSDVDRNIHSTFTLLNFFLIRRVEKESPLAAFQIRGTHAGEEMARRKVWEIGSRISAEKVKDIVFGGV